MPQPIYIIVAGVNGAGKSTLYQTDPDLFLNTHRLNADEILRNNGGDWHLLKDNLAAMRQEVTLLHQALNRRESVHIETTLAGNGNTHLKLIQKAHQQNFEVYLLYVSLENVQLAIDRVQERINKGGHGIAPELIKKRYKQSLNNLIPISAEVDQVKIFDNTQKLKLVYARNHQKVVENNLTSFPWLPPELPMK